MLTRCFRLTVCVMPPAASCSNEFCSVLFSVLSVPGSQPEHYLVLQVAAVLVRLPDLLLQLLAALVLIGQLLGQQLAALPGLAQVLQGGGGLHLHRLGDVLSRPKQSGSTKRQCVMLLQQVFFFCTFTTGSLPFSRSNSSCSSFTLSSRFLSSSPLLHSLCSLRLSRWDS